MSPKSIARPRRRFSLRYCFWIDRSRRRPDGAPIPTGELSNISIDNFGRVDATHYRSAEPPDDQ
jgi:hypothetical protein